MTAQIRDGSLAHQLSKARGKANRYAHALDQVDKWQASENSERYAHTMVVELISELDLLVQTLGELMPELLVEEARRREALK